MAKADAKANSKKSVGRYVDPVARGRVTKRRPPSDKHSPHWWGPLVLVLLVAGMLTIVLNYLQVLPGAASPWYLAAGLLVLFVGFYLATHYR